MSNPTLRDIGLSAAGRLQLAALPCWAPGAEIEFEPGAMVVEYGGRRYRFTRDGQSCRCEVDGVSGAHRTIPGAYTNALRALWAARR